MLNNKCYSCFLLSQVFTNKSSEWLSESRKKKFPYHMIYVFNFKNSHTCIIYRLVKIKKSYLGVITLKAPK